MPPRRFAVVKELLGDGDKTEANPGTFANVLLDSAPPLDKCGAREVVVSVRAATVNYPDLLQTVGGYQHKPPLPYTPGTEGAGVVTRVGEKVTALKVGDRVAFGAAPPRGAMATEVRVQAAGCWRLPAAYSFAEGAGFNVGYSTAYHCIVERAALKKGEAVLIHGATGGMGLAALHIAKVIGASPIIASGGSDEKLAVVKAQGADVVINYTKTPRFRDAVKAATGGRGVAVVYDPVGGDVFDETIRCVQYGCRICVLGFTSGRRPTIATNRILIKGISLLGCRAGESVRQGQADGETRTRTLREWAEAGKLRPYVSHTYPLEEAPAAFRALWGRGVVGRCVVAPHGVELARARL